MISPGFSVTETLTPDPNSNVTHYRGLDDAEKRPAPLAKEFKKGFDSRKIGGGVTALFATILGDLASMRIALNSVDFAALDDDKKETYTCMAWKGCLQTAYMIFIALQSDIYMSVESFDGHRLRAIICRHDVETEPRHLEGYDPDAWKLPKYKPAWEYVDANFSDFFYDAVRETGATQRLINRLSPKTIAASLHNGFHLLRHIEEAHYFAYTHCTDADSAEIKDYHLSFAQAAFLIRETAFNRLFKGVPGCMTKPIYSGMTIDKKKIGKTKLNSFENSVSDYITRLSFGNYTAELLAQAQALVNPKAPAFEVIQNQMLRNEAKLW